MSAILRTDESFDADADAARWMSVLARTTVLEATDLDALLYEYDHLAAARVGETIFPPLNETPLRATGAEDLRPAIGFRVDADAAAHPQILATRAAELAALAVERDCEIIVISDSPVAGLERFGFRVERLAGDSEDEKEACLQQIRDFWSLAVIL